MKTFKQLVFTEENDIIKTSLSGSGGSMALLQACCIGGVRSHADLSREHAPAGTAFFFVRRLACET